MTSLCQSNRGFKDALRTQPGSGDMEEGGHVLAAGQSKCNVRVYHRPVAP